MKYKLLLLQSKTNLERNPSYVKGIVSSEIFNLGAKWMFDKLNENNKNNELNFNSSTNFFAYGLLKYGISLSAFLFTAYMLLKVSFFLLPLSIIIFYLIEVHFLFLFPILLDNLPRPVLTSIRQTYRIGLLHSLLTVIPIGLFMMVGLLRLSDPFRNWYIGCLAILIWYQNEIRDRV